VHDRGGHRCARAVAAVGVNLVGLLKGRYLRAPRYRVLTLQGFMEWIERVSVWGEARRHVRRVVPVG
jgi:hypothetical protein